MHPLLVAKLIVLLSIANGTPVLLKKLFGDRFSQPIDRHARPCAGHDDGYAGDTRLQITEHLRPDGDHPHKQRERCQRGGLLNDNFDHGSLP